MKRSGHADQVRVHKKQGLERFHWKRTLEKGEPIQDVDIADMVVRFVGSDPNPLKRFFFSAFPNEFGVNGQLGWRLLSQDCWAGWFGFGSDVFFLTKVSIILCAGSIECMANATNAANAGAMFFISFHEFCRYSNLAILQPAMFAYQIIHDNHFEMGTKYTWMSQEVSKWLASGIYPQYTPSIRFYTYRLTHLLPIY